LTKTKTAAGTDFKVHPYLIANDLSKKKNQPKFVRTNDFYNRVLGDVSCKEGDAKEATDMRRTTSREKCDMSRITEMPLSSP
jgi:hypothetical protein